MGQKLRAIFAASDWKLDPGKQSERITYLQVVLSHKLSANDEITVRMELANEQLRAGFSVRAAETLELLMQHIQSRIAEIPVARQAEIHQLLALSYLRIGEQQNCVGMHNPLSCNYPLRGEGLHKNTAGAESAIREYTTALELNPGCAICRWLLNVAYMQLGRYPRDVPPKWLAPEKVFASEYDIGYFPEMSGLAGLDVFGRAGGLVVEDFDGDGFLDVLVSSSGPLDPMHFFHNEGDGTFTDRTLAAGLGDEVGGLNMVLTDFNNDGYPDVLVLRGGWWGKFGEYPMSLLRNNGDGTFDDVTVEAGLESTGPGQTAAWADYDGDGWLDLFVGHESSPGDVHPAQLFHNNRDGTFTEVRAPGNSELNSGAAPGANLGYVKGAAWGDFNRDGRPDLYVSTMFGASYLFRNDGPMDPRHPENGQWKFTDVTVSAGLGGKRFTFPTWFFDYDNDGWPDIFAGGYSTSSMEDVGKSALGLPNQASKTELFHNNGDGTFTGVPHAGGLDRSIMVMGANFGDLDNDGWLDVYTGLGEPSYEAILPKRMYRNDRGRRFQDVTVSGGFGNLQKGHAIAFADIENDGNEDVLEELGGAYPGDGFHVVLYRNPGHGNHWITLILQGVRSNRPGFGAQIKVTVGNGASRRSIYRTVGSVSSFGGNPFEQHLGLGEAPRVGEIQIWWPASGIRQKFTDVAADRVYRVREDSSDLQPVARRSFEIGKSKIAASAHHHGKDAEN